MATQTYHGSCQCGAVSIDVPLDLDRAMACNCSRCRRMGWALVFAPAAKATISGEEATTEYLFNRHAIHHRFCATCGVELYARGAQPDGTPVVAVNVNCLDGVDAWTLSPRRVDGARF